MIMILIMSASSVEQWATPQYCSVRLYTRVYGQTISWRFLLINIIGRERVCVSVYARMQRYFAEYVDL